MFHLLEVLRVNFIEAGRVYIQRQQIAAGLNGRPCGIGAQIAPRFDGKTVAGVGHIGYIGQVKQRLFYGRGLAIDFQMQLIATAQHLLRQFGDRPL